MEITVTSSDGSEPEVYESLEALKSELEISATDDYASAVHARIHAGERYFIMPNGPRFTDVYEIED